MPSKITIFDHFMKKLTELDHIPTTPRSWVLNQYGRCEFSIGFDPRLSQSQQKCNEKYLQFGNLVHIEHVPSKDWLLRNNGKLPDWTGIILPPRTWDNGVVHVTAYSAEAILAFRSMPYVTVSNTPANVFKEIIGYAIENARNIIFQTDFVDDLPIIFPDDLVINGYEHIKKLVSDCGMDWDVTGSINDKGDLELSANLYRSKGTVTDFTLTNENTELQSPLLTEQGTPFNQVFGYSHAQTKNSRHTVVAVNQEAFDDYGPLQLNQVYVGKHDKASTYQSATMTAAARGRPAKLFKRVVLDKRNAFNYLEVGNVMNIKDNVVGFNVNGGFGFEAQVKIISMDYNDLSNKVPLNIEVI